MKKFLLIIFLFFCCINVFAEERSFAGNEYLDNIYYVKSTGGNTQYRRAQVIRDTATGEIAYCVEPFGRIIDNNLYDGVTSFDLRFGLSEDKWEKIKLYAYYGYGYKNHQNKEWISITQMMIWRTIYPSYTFEYVDDTSTGNIISRFENEFNELNALVNNHSTLPSFETEYIFSIGDNITLSDSNNVLNNYKIINSDLILKYKIIH